MAIRRKLGNKWRQTTKIVKINKCKDILIKI